MIKVYTYEGITEEECRKKYIEELDVYVCDIVTKEQVLDNHFQVKLIKKDDIIEYIKNYLKSLFAIMELKTNIEVRNDEDNFNVIIISKENGSILIGKDGRTLDSIQILLRQTIATKTGFNLKINLDSSNYKIKKQKRFEFDIKNIAREVQKTELDVKLEPMNSYYRRIVHSLLSDYDNIETESIGVEPNRCVVIKYIERKYTN